MRARDRQRLWALALLVATLSLILVHQLPAEKQIFRALEMTDADYFIKDVSIFRFDSQGRKTSQLTATKLEHFEQGDLSKPELLTYEINGTSWQLRAAKGELTEHHQKLNFIGGVKLQQQYLVTRPSSIPDAQPATQITTEQLALDFAQGLARTNLKVVMLTTQSRTHGDGFELDLNQDSLTIRHHVETELLRNEH